MDESSIQVLQEYLTAFQALASTHTTAIGNLLAEFDDDQLLLMLETERAFKKATQGQTDEAETSMAPKEA